MKTDRALRLGLLLLVLPPSAHAYVDPGTGMLLIQGLVAVVGAIVVFVRHPIASIKALIAKLRKK